MKYPRGPFVEFAYGDGDTQAARQEDIWIVHSELACAPGHPFYKRLNELLEAEQFDQSVGEVASLQVNAITNHHDAINGKSVLGIKSGHLKARFRGTARGEQQNGDSYLIQEKDVRYFTLEHPTDIDLRKVDQLWFLDLITNGLVHAA